MFGWLRRKTDAFVRERSALAELCCAEIEQEWSRYKSEGRIAEYLPLHASLGMFTAGMAEMVRENYPSLVSRRGGTIITLVMIAVYRDKTFADAELGPAFVQICQTLQVKPEPLF